MHDARTISLVKESLPRILRDERFSSSPQMSAFLRYVVEEAMEGNADRIKAYSVAVDALGKPASFDAQKDPSVRVLAMRLRENLANYYQTHDEAVVIEIPRGSYKPKFLSPENTEQLAAPEGMRTAQAEGYATMQFDATATAQNEDSDSAQSVSTSTTQKKASDTTQNVVSGSNTESIPANTTMTGTMAAGADGSSEAITASATNTGKREQKKTLDATLSERTSAFSTPQVLRWSALALLLVLAIWTAIYSRPDSIVGKQITSAANTTPQALQNAPNLGESSQANSAKLLRTRPNMPTVHIYSNPGSDELIHQIDSTMSGVLGKFSSLEIIRDLVGLKPENAWPEDYELRSNQVKVEEQIRINAELIHVMTGTMVFSASYEIEKTSEGAFTPQTIEIIEAFSAQLGSRHGPLIGDYRQRDGIHPEVACRYELAERSAHHITPSSERIYLEHKLTERQTELTDNCKIISTLLDKTQVVDILLLANLELDSAVHNEETVVRQAKLENALSIAEQAVALAPYRADTHKLLMTTLQLLGSLDRAATHGARAMELNRYDSEFLGHYSQVLSQLDKQESSATVLAMAQKLRPFNTNELPLCLEQSSGHNNVLCRTRPSSLDD